MCAQSCHALESVCFCQLVRRRPRDEEAGRCKSSFRTPHLAGAVGHPGGRSPTYCLDLHSLAQLGTITEHLVRKANWAVAM